MQAVFVVEPGGGNERASACFVGFQDWLDAEGVREGGLQLAAVHNLAAAAAALVRALPDTTPAHVAATRWPNGAVTLHVSPTGPTCLPAWAGFDVAARES